MKRPGAARTEKAFKINVSERHLSQRSVLSRVLVMMSRHDRMGGRCRTNGAPSRLALRATGSAGLRP